jgi:hypothetical protein
VATGYKRVLPPLECVCMDEHFAVASVNTVPRRRDASDKLDRFAAQSTTAQPCTSFSVAARLVLHRQSPCLCTLCNTVAKRQADTL